jgi:hypothetical protein
MRRLTARQEKVVGDLQPKSPSETVEGAGSGPKITAEGDYLVLRWKKEQAAEALDTVGMTLERVLTKHVIPRLDATKTVRIKFGGVITDEFAAADWNTRFKMATLVLELYGVFPK